MERRYRRTCLPADRLAWVEQERKRHRIYREKESSYWTAIVTSQACQPKKLWRAFNTIMQKDKSGASTKRCPSAQQLLDYFNEKVASVHNTTGTGISTDTSGKGEVKSSLPSTLTFLGDFQPCTHEEIRSTIMKAPSKSCSLDPLPTALLKEFLPELLPYLSKMCNSSLMQGHLPLCQRQAIITPRLKKLGSDPMNVKNYRPISNLTFMSKVIERLVCHQLVAYLEANSLIPVHQSAYRKRHSTETAVLKVVSDILRAADSGKISLLCLLDLSAAFDTVDHEILIDRLRKSYGIEGTVLSWIESFISCRTQYVAIDGQQSAKCAVSCGVPQGSVLGPVLFLLYTAEVLLIAKRHGLEGHSYADDTQTVFSRRP